MLHIAVVENDLKMNQQLRSFINRYEKEHKLPIKMTFFQSGGEIVEQYRPIYDVIFLSIEIPQMDGMETARRIRALDSVAALVFLANDVKYALEGYEVRAVDFVLRPVVYNVFSQRLTHAVRWVEAHTERRILLTFPDGVVCLDAQTVSYIDVRNQMLHYHTEQGEFAARGTMRTAEDQLRPYYFTRCNCNQLVNLRFVTEVRKNTVLVGGCELAVSRRKRTPLMTALADYIKHTD